MDRPQFLVKVVNWLREGYPNGVPSGDYVPLFALLRRQLSDDEVKTVARQLIQSGQGPGGDPEPVTSVDVGVLITKVTDELPSDADVERVRKRLEYKGWPFDPNPLGDPPADETGE